MHDSFIVLKVIFTYFLFVCTLSKRRSEDKLQELFLFSIMWVLRPGSRYLNALSRLTGPLFRFGISYN